MPKPKLLPVPTFFPNRPIPFPVPKDTLGKKYKSRNRKPDSSLPRTIYVKKTRAVTKNTTRYRLYRAGIYSQGNVIGESSFIDTDKEIFYERLLAEIIGEIWVCYKEYDGTPKNYYVRRTSSKLDLRFIVGGNGLAKT